MSFTGEVLSRMPSVWPLKFSRRPFFWAPTMSDSATNTIARTAIFQQTKLQLLQWVVLDPHGTGAERWGASRGVCAGFSPTVTCI